jgi:hypothetical protein
VYFDVAAAFSVDLLGPVFDFRGDSQLKVSLLLEQFHDVAVARIWPFPSGLHTSYTRLEGLQLALVGFESDFRPLHPWTMNAVYSLTNVYRRQKKYNHALM